MAPGDDGKLPQAEIDDALAFICEDRYCQPTPHEFVSYTHHTLRTTTQPSSRVMIPLQLRGGPTLFLLDCRINPRADFLPAHATGALDSLDLQYIRATTQIAEFNSRNAIACYRTNK